eukprot:8495372-Alexandrium_andersonii.AAC.1
MTGLGRARKVFHVWVLAGGLCLSAAPVHMSTGASQNACCKPLGRYCCAGGAAFCTHRVPSACV